MGAGAAESICPSVQELLAKVQSTLRHMRYMVVLDSTSATIAGIVDALAP
jgi:hypothetical protein